MHPFLRRLTGALAPLALALALLTPAAGAPAPRPPAPVALPPWQAAAMRAALEDPSRAPRGRRLAG